MQINGLGGTLVYNSFLTNSAKIKNIPEPKFSNSFENGAIFLTKTEATRSDEEIINDVLALAKKTEITANSPEFQKLLKEYVSPYSPDRKAIFANGVDSSLNEIKNRISNPVSVLDSTSNKRKYVVDNSLIKLLLSGKSAVETSFFYDSSNKTFDVGVVKFFENGEDIGSYSGNHGWGMTPTGAESARWAELTKIYVDAWNAESSSGNSVANLTNFTTYNVSNQQTQTTQTIPAQQAISRYEKMQYADY